MDVNPNILYATLELLEVILSAKSGVNLEFRCAPTPQNKIKQFFKKDTIVKANKRQQQTLNFQRSWLETV